MSSKKNKYKKKKGKSGVLPNGWLKITWKDAQGRKRSSNIPESMESDISARIYGANGTIIKIE